MAELQPDPIGTLSEADALQVVRRAAAARGVPWPQDPKAVHGVGGLTGPFTGRGTQALAWATIGRNGGLVGLSEGGKLLASADKALGEILRVQPVTLPGLPGYALIVDDRYDDMVGAFTREERRRIYVWDGRSLREVYKGMLSGEQFTHSTWDNPRAAPLWRLDRMTGEINLSDGTLHEVTRLQKMDAPGKADEPVPPLERFRQISETKSEKRLQWNARLRRFDPVQQ